MRLIIALLLLIQLSFGLLWCLRPEDEADLTHSVPHDVLGLLILNPPIPDLTQLRSTRAAAWLEWGKESIQEGSVWPGEGIVKPLLDRHIERAYILLHGLEPRTNQTYRMHVTALLVPKPFHGRALELAVRLALNALFASREAFPAEAGSVSVYRGAKREQLVYQVRMPRFLLLSNSLEGWRKTLRTGDGQLPDLRESTTFRRIQAYLPWRQGVFLYVDGRRILPLLPTFGYSVRWQEERLRDDWYAVDPSRR